MQLLAVGKPKLANKVLPGRLHGFHTGFVASTAFISDLGPDGPAVGWIGNTSDQLVRLQPVHKLGDVRFYACDLLRQLPQSEGLIGLGQMTERPELGQRQAGRLQRTLQTVLDHTGDVHDGGKEVVRLSHT